MSTYEREITPPLEKEQTKTQEVQNVAEQLIGQEGEFYLQAETLKSFSPAIKNTWATGNLKDTLTTNPIDFQPINQVSDNARYNDWQKIERELRTKENIADDQPFDAFDHWETDMSDYFIGLQTENEQKLHFYQKLGIISTDSNGKINGKASTQLLRDRFFDQVNENAQVLIKSRVDRFNYAIFRAANDGDAATDPEADETYVELNGQAAMLRLKAYTPFVEELSIIFGSDIVEIRRHLSNGIANVQTNPGVFKQTATLELQQITVAKQQTDQDKQIDPQTQRNLDYLEKLDTILTSIHHHNTSTIQSESDITTKHNKTPDQLIAEITSEISKQYGVDITLSENVKQLIERSGRMSFMDVVKDSYSQCEREGMANNHEIIMRIMKNLDEMALFLLFKILPPETD